jgi:tetratricopeptide (TPR) repeat protein
VPLDAAVFDGQPHQISVRERRSGQTLEGAPKWLRPIAGGSALVFERPPQAAPSQAAMSVAADPATAAAALNVDAAAANIAAVNVAAANADVAAAAAAATATGFDAEMNASLSMQRPSQPVADAIAGRPIVQPQSELESQPDPEPGPFAQQRGEPVGGSAASVADELQGRFEGVVDGQVRGWAIDPLRPEMRVELELLCDGEPIALMRADLEREDLEEVMLGDGRHGFRLTLDSRLFDGQAHQLSVRSLRTQQLLPGSPQRLQSEAPPARVRPADVQGAFESISDSRALGYAWDLSRPEHRLEVEILCDGEVVGRAPANTFRGDLYASGVGDGRHAFSVPISYQLFDGKPHWLTAREAHTGKSLAQGPHLFEQPSANWPFDLMSRAETLRQLAALISGPEVASRGVSAEQCRERLVEASLRQEMRQTEAARLIYGQLLEQLGDNALCHCKLAETWLLDGEPDPALDAYRRAAALPHAPFWAYLGVGNAFKLREHFVEAEDAYQSALRHSPRQPLVLQRLQEVCARAVPMRVDRLVADGQIEEGIRLLQTRLIEEPENPMILNKLSTLLARQQGAQPISAHLGSAQDQDDEVAAFDNSLRVLELLLAEGDRRLSAGVRP